MRGEKSIDHLASGVFRGVGQGNHPDDALAPDAGLLERFGEPGKGVVGHCKLLPILPRPEGPADLSGTSFVENADDRLAPVLR